MQSLSEGNYDNSDIIYPDTIKNEGDKNYAIIYTTNGSLYVDKKSGRSHKSMYLHRRDVKQALQNDITELDEHGIPQNWFALYNKHLFGRMGILYDKKYVAFWGRGSDYQNPNAKGPAHLIPKCVTELYYNDYIDDDYIVVYGNGQETTTGNILNNIQPQQKESDDMAQFLRLKYHTSTGVEKQAIANQLGLVRNQTPKSISQWDAALKKHGSSYWGESIIEKISKMME